MSEIITKNSKTAIVLFNLGGPDSPKSVKPFLFNLFHDKAIINIPQPFRYFLAKIISSSRAPIAREIYDEIGGKSPIVEQTKMQADSLKNVLEEHGEVEVFISMRYWHPMSLEVAREVKKYNPDHIILLPLYPQYSTTTTGSSFKDWEESAEKIRLKKPTIKIQEYYDNKGFLASYADKIRKKYFDASALGNPRILFSAHGLPEDIIKKGDPYQTQVEASVKGVVELLAIPELDYVTCYQSKVGPKKWITPSTEDEILRGCSDKVPLVIVPIAFVSEHSETLVELDIEYRELAEEHDVISYIRIPTLQNDPSFIETLADLCLREKVAVK